MPITGPHSEMRPGDMLADRIGYGKVLFRILGTLPPFLLARLAGIEPPRRV